MYFFYQGGVKITLICLTFALLANSKLVNAKNSNFAYSRIVNGEILSIKNAPYTVQIRNETDDVICGATLVTSQHLVTAAHCFLDYEPKELHLLSVMAGVSLRREIGERRLIGKLFMHPKRRLTHYDVAVVKLDRPLPIGGNIQIMDKLCSKPLQAADQIQVYGWGKLRHDGPYSAELRTISVPILSNEECVSSPLKPWYSADSMVCAYNDGQDSCTTDSGGPAIFEEQLCGIVSWGIECAKKDSPGVYVNVYAVRDFIGEKIKT